MMFGISPEKRLWSLEEMITHYCFWMCDAYRTLELSIDLLTAVSRGFSVMDANSQRETARMAAEKILTQGHSLGWQLSDQIRAEHLVRDLKNGTPFSAETLVRELSGLRTSFHVALQTAKFAYVPTPDDQYFENEKLFGEEVFVNFKEARQDVKESGNCLASGLHTACVFHLMRISEFGLRRIAARLRVKLFDKGKPQQVEYATWNKVIEGVQSKIKEARQLSAGTKKEARLIRLSEAGDHCTFMKDIFRNNLSHTRKPYIRDEALAAFRRVNDFMNFLVDGLNEKKT
jgi:hypothetical protein